MGRRVYFNSKEIRELFFRKVLNSFSLRNWKELRELFNMPKSTFEFYKSGKFTLPEKIYLELYKNLYEKDKIFFNKEIKFLDSNWGSVKAGKITYSRHKEIFDNGRKKAISAIRKEVADKFDIEMPLNSELAYFIGLFIGDGFTNKYQRYYMIEITGDKRTEKEFYANYISLLVNNLFNLKAYTSFPKESNALRFILYSKILFKMITKRFKIAAGRKSHFVLIPEEILNSKLEIIKSCLRGLYDAEGCVFFDKRKAYKKPYPRIELHMNNLRLLEQVHNLLIKFGVKCSLGKIKDNLRITIWGSEDVKKFSKEIGFSNPKHLEKLKVLKD